MATYSPPSIYWADSTTDPQPEGNRNFRWQSTNGTKHYYRGYNGANIDIGDMEIYYDTDDQKWHDSGTDHPNAFVVNTTQSVPTDWSNASDPSAATDTDNEEYVHLRRNTTNNHLFSFKMAGWSSSGPTVTTARTTHSGTIPNANDFTIRPPNPGPWYEKTGIGKFKIKFFDQNEPFGGYNITISWTSLDNSAASHTETISAAAGDYSIEIDTLTDGVKHNSNITISFNTATVYNGVTYTANSVLRTFTYLSNGPFSGSFTPDVGPPNGSIVTVSIEDNNPYPGGLRVLSYKEPDGTKANVTLNSANSWSATATFFNDTPGTAYIYDTDTNNQTSQNIIASARYNFGSGNNGYPRDGYPIVMTNSFNRKRSIYSIGMTHKTATDPFL